MKENAFFNGINWKSVFDRTSNPPFTIVFDPANIRADDIDYIKKYKLGQSVPIDIVKPGVGTTFDSNLELFSMIKFISQ